MKTFSNIAICAGIIIALTGCDLFKTGKTKDKDSMQVPEVKGTVVAMIGNYPITLDELNREVEEYNKEIEEYNKKVPEEQRQPKLTTSEQKQRYLKDEMVRKVMFYLEALNRQIDKKEDISAILERTKQTLLAVELVKQETENIKVDPKEIEDAYKELVANNKLKETEQRKIREIAFSSDQAASEAMIQLLQGGDFAALAAERSIAPSRASSGDIGWIEKGKRGPDFAKYDEVAFSDALDVGRISNIFKGPGGSYYILKIEDKKGGKVKTMEESWEFLKAILTINKNKEQIDKLAGELSKKMTIQVNASEIK